MALVRENAIDLIISDIDRFVRGMNLPAEYKTGYVGQSNEMGKAGFYFLLAFALSFVFMYIVLAAQYTEGQAVTQGERVVRKLPLLRLGMTDRTKSDVPTPVPSVTTSSIPLPEIAASPCMSASFTTRTGFLSRFSSSAASGNPFHCRSARFGAFKILPRRTTPGKPTETRS